MANTLKPKQKAIVEFIEAIGLATPRQSGTQLSFGIREAIDLRMAGIVKNIGKPRHPEYRLYSAGAQRLNHLNVRRKHSRWRTFVAKTGGLSDTQNFRIGAKA
ncbi:hypothetical protein CWM66_02250 [Kosakonia sp. H7A]|uniref:hypothetical protein n=1 Tax=Kosakonia sp. H7A TaxID=2054598 RepID=UPI000D16FEDD|nr:hypothetical protein [Kosakonia sp. H7A]PTA92884.1 hypothetical protein CWM66_02250 [Kosakonia sp. H7A]